MLVPLRDYTNQELIEKKDELSLVMLINKMRSAADFAQLKEIPSEYFEHLDRETPEELVVQIMGQGDLECLRKWIKLAARARSVEEFWENMLGA